MPCRGQIGWQAWKNCEKTSQRICDDYSQKVSLQPMDQLSSEDLGKLKQTRQKLTSNVNYLTLLRQDHQTFHRHPRLTKRTFPMAANTGNLVSTDLGETRDRTFFRLRLLPLAHLVRILKLLMIADSR